jgi:GNAT superfamily N-acetyltransferase
MTNRVICVLFVGLACLATGGAESVNRSRDPMLELTKNFPKTVALKNRGRLLEFCPDNTCDAFSASSSVSVDALKDFAYLYIYFFSDFYVLQEWRRHGDSKETAEHVLSKADYRGCKNDDSREAARCVLLRLSRNARIKLLFINYDEGKRNVTREDIAEQLSEKNTVPKQ